MVNEDQLLGWLQTLANDLIKNQATLITVQNLTNVTGSPHWVPLALATDEYTLLFGDSLGMSFLKSYRRHTPGGWLSTTYSRVPNQKILP